MLERARSKVSAANVRFVCGDLREPLPFADAGFDLVAVDLVLEHLADLRAVLAEIARVLRPGGLAVIIELHPFRQLAGKGARFAPGDSTVREVEAYVHPVSELVGAARAAGLAIDALEEWIDGPRPAPAETGAIPRLLSLKLGKPRDQR